MNNIKTRPQQEPSAKRAGPRDRRPTRWRGGARRTEPWSLSWTSYWWSEHDEDPPVSSRLRPSTWTRPNGLRRYQEPMLAAPETCRLQLHRWSNPWWAWSRSRSWGFGRPRRIWGPRLRATRRRWLAASDLSPLIVFLGRRMHGQCILLWPLILN